MRLAPAACLTNVGRVGADLTSRDLELLPAAAFVYLSYDMIELSWKKRKGKQAVWNDGTEVMARRLVLAIEYEKCVIKMITGKERRKAKEEESLKNSS